jgi:amidophosphoribosyltransferase
MFRERATGTEAITEIFDRVYAQYKNLPNPHSGLPFAGELYVGHLRYSTTDKSGLAYVHPFLRRSNWRARNLAICGNFNMTNVHEIFRDITSTGQHPRRYADTYFILEQLGHRLDREAERLYRHYEAQGLESMAITRAIEEHIDTARVIAKAAQTWDGGYVICGLTGSGEAFSIRDPWGIRTAFYYADDEIVVLASERPVIQTVMNVRRNDVRELQRGEALFVNRAGNVRTAQILPPQPLSACSFERIYFSRGSDADIYGERKRLGKNLVGTILQKINFDVQHTVFSFIPNTAEVAYYGMLEGLQAWLDERKTEQIVARGSAIRSNEVKEILAQRIRSEKVALKDIKLRTFIAEGNSRNDLAAHVYDITYGSITPGEDNLVVIDDSIVRGTTLRQSIIRILDRLKPKRIIFVSSSPQIRYPDYYGINMSSMDEFIAFKAAIELLCEQGLEELILDTYRRAKQRNDETKHNAVKAIYAPFTDEDLSKKMARMLSGPDIGADVELVFQTIEGLHAACPKHPGDWYFSGNYPTPGGTRMVNRTFVRYMEEHYFNQPNKQ